MPVYVGGCSIESRNIASSNKTPTMDPDLAIQNLKLKLFLFFRFFSRPSQEAGFLASGWGCRCSSSGNPLGRWPRLRCRLSGFKKTWFRFCPTSNFYHHPARLRTLDGRLLWHIVQDFTSQKRLRVAEPSKIHLKQFWKNKIKHLSSPSGGWAYLTPWKEAYGLPEVLLVHL